MGACATKATSSPRGSISSPVSRGPPKIDTTQQQAPATPKDKDAESDPHSDTDTNGARTIGGIGGTDIDLHIVPILSPPVNALLAPSGAVSRSGPGGVSLGGVQFSPSATGGSFFHQRTVSSVASGAQTQSNMRSISGTSSLFRSLSGATVPVVSPAVTWVEAHARPSVEHAAMHHTEAVTDLCLTDVDGETVSCSADKSIVVYNWKSRTSEKWSQHAKPVSRLRFAPKTRQFFSASRDNTIRQWQSHQFKEVQLYRGHTLPVTALLLRDSMLISGSRDYSLREWHIDSGVQASMHTIAHNVVTCMQWIAPPVTHASFAGASIIAAPDAPMPASSSAGVGAGLDAHCFLQGSEDPSASVRIWDARTMSVVGVFPSGGDKCVRALQSDPTDANKFIVVTDPAALDGSSTDAEVGGEIRLWDRRRISSNIALDPDSSIEPVISILAHADTINAVVYLPQLGNNANATSFLATASSDKTLKVWDLSASNSSDFPSSRCTQVIQYRDPKPSHSVVAKYQAPFTSLAVSPRPVTNLHAFGAANANANSTAASSASSASAFVLYAGTSQGMLSAFSWATTKQRPSEGRLEILAQTKPVTQTQTR